MQEGRLHSHVRHVGQAGEGVVPLLALLHLPQAPLLLELHVLVLVDEAGDVVEDGAGVVADPKLFDRRSSPFTKSGWLSNSMWTFVRYALSLP